jgi:hypothetical protein
VRLLIILLLKLAGTLHGGVPAFMHVSACLISCYFWDPILLLTQLGSGLVLATAGKKKRLSFGVSVVGEAWKPAAVGCKITQDVGR